MTRQIVFFFDFAKATDITPLLRSLRYLSRLFSKKTRHFDPNVLVSIVRYAAVASDSAEQNPPIFETLSKVRAPRPHPVLD